MIECKKCGTKYEDDASYCNNCDLSLIDEKGVSLEVNVLAEHIIIEGYEKDLERLFSNLLSNAVKYTPSDGKASLTVETSDDAVNIVVTDTGIGIPEDAMDKLFTVVERY